MANDNRNDTRQDTRQDTRNTRDATDDNAPTDPKLDEELRQGGAESVLGSRRRPLPPEAEAEIEKARIQNMIVAAIAGLSWGKNMSTAMRRAFADYCRRYDVDPVVEMDNLGGTPYVNAEWYLRKLGELRMKKIIRDFTLEHIHADKRLDALRKDETLPADMRAEAQRRWFDMLLKRIEQNAPEDAEAICVCSLDIGDGGSPIRGCKWAGNGTSVPQPSRNGSRPNPVAEANPTLSVESQSIRRALRQLYTHVSGAIALPNPEKMTEDIDELRARAEAQQDEHRTAEEAVHEREAQRQHMLASPDALGQIPEYKAPDVVAAEQRAAKRDAATWRSTNDADPYAEPNPRTFADELQASERESADELRDAIEGNPFRNEAIPPQHVEGVEITSDAGEREQLGPGTITMQRKCFKCSEIVSDLYTPEHKTDCPFYKPPRLTIEADDGGKLEMF